MLKRELAEEKADKVIMSGIIKGQHNPKDVDLITQLVCELAGYRVLGSVEQLRDRIQEIDNQTT